MKTVILFDVNETLLDLRALEPLFERAFGNAQVREQWFREMLLLAFQATILDQYRPFGEHARAALRMLAQQLERPLSDADERAILDQMKQLPAFPDVAPGLTRLRQADFRMAALTNSTEEVGTAQLRHAGIFDQFERVFSADRVRRLKPAPEPYQMAAYEMGVAPADAWLVAAHGWDVAGAAAVGCRTAFLARPGKVLDPLGPAPTLVAKDVGAIAGLLLEAAAAR
ncbi:MAG: haloacid dehalogenase type II [Gemmatimonadales bacterium]|nr:haloacid dehalogenase type II [Gemmatimonadales bacterium]